MKLTIKRSVALFAILTSLQSLHVSAETSATVGFVSDYYFRGLNLGDAGAYASIDYSSNGFSAGTWWIDDGSGGNDGLETDYYLSYGKELDTFSWSVGYNRYEYSNTSDFEHELIINLSKGSFSFDMATGEDDDAGAQAEDYSVYIVSYSKSYFGLTVGTGDYSDVPDSRWSWVQASFSGEVVEGVSTSLNLGVKTDEATGTQDDGYIYLDFSKSFDL